MIKNFKINFVRKKNLLKFNSYNTELKILFYLV